MSIKIDIKKHVKVFEIGSHKFELILEDKKLAEFIKEVQRIQNKQNQKEIFDENPERAFEVIEQQHRQFLEVCFTDKEAYDKISKEVNGSTYVMASVLEQISDEVENIVLEMTQEKRNSKKENYYNKPERAK